MINKKYQDICCALIFFLFCLVFLLIQDIILIYSLNILDVPDGVIRFSAALNKDTSTLYNFFNNFLNWNLKNFFISTSTFALDINVNNDPIYDYSSYNLIYKNLYFIRYLLIFILTIMFLYIITNLHNPYFKNTKNWIYSIGLTLLLPSTSMMSTWISNEIWPLFLSIFIFPLFFSNRYFSTLFILALIFYLDKGYGFIISASILFLITIIQMNKFDKKISIFFLIFLLVNIFIFSSYIIYILNIIPNSTIDLFQNIINVLKVLKSKDYENATVFLGLIRFSYWFVSFIFITDSFFISWFGLFFVISSLFIIIIYNYNKFKNKIKLSFLGNNYYIESYLLIFAVWSFIFMCVSFSPIHVNHKYYFFLTPLIIMILLKVFNLKSIFLYLLFLSFIINVELYLVRNLL